MADKIKLLIVEDHSLTRIGLKFSLEKYENLDIVGEAADGIEAIEKNRELKPDVILMDLGMPRKNGIETTAEIKKEFNDTMIIILTSHDTEDEVLAAFSSGADAYCMKDIPPERLIQVIDSVLDGAVWLDPAIAEIVLKYLPARNTATTKHTTEEFNLKPVEVEILKLIVEGHSNADIAFELKTTMQTIRHTTSSILSKLGVSDRTQAAVKALKENLV
jgi:DNA-binding NarL/FixJ family response regulator